MVEVTSSAIHLWRYIVTNDESKGFTVARLLFVLEFSFVTLFKNRHNKRCKNNELESEMI